MSDKSNSDENAEQNSIEALAEKKEELEAMGLEASHIDEQISEAEHTRELEERRVDLKMKISEAEEMGMGDDPAVEALQDQVVDISKQLEDDDDEPTETEILERRIEMGENSQTALAEHMAEDAREKLNETGVGDTHSDRVQSKFDRLQERATGEDAETLSEYAENWGFYAAMADQIGFDGEQTMQNRIADIAARHDIDLSEIADRPVDA